GSKATGEDMIEGELKQRKVIYKPDPPVLNIESDVTITLKFTVLPNGEVDQIFPYRKAGPELERLAMQLLRQYRFEPLFENGKVQQGIIHFSIYRNKNR
ncbi:MAG: energy transducer TonB, partial [bacterium]